MATPHFINEDAEDINPDAVENIVYKDDHNFVPRAVRKSFIWLYRGMAVIVLYGVLGGVFWYCFVMSFYAVNSSWVAPRIISPSDPKSVDCMLKITQANTAIQSLELDAAKLQDSLPEFYRHREVLLGLAPQLAAAVAREKVHSRSTGTDLLQLNRQKHSDNLKMAFVIKQTKEVEEQIDKDLKAGLITRADAATAHVSLTQAANTLTDSQIAEIMMKDAILQKNTVGTTLLEILRKQAELTAEISELGISIDTAQRQIKSDQEQIAGVQHAMDMARQTPYYLAVTQGRKVNFAFVPYGNHTSVKIGNPVYGCYLNMLICRQVGTVKAFFPQEEHAVHPLFRSDMRGFLIQIELTSPEAAESETLMLNRKPLLF